MSYSDTNDSIIRTIYIWINSVEIEAYFVFPYEYLEAVHHSGFKNFPLAFPVHMFESLKIDSKNPLNNKTKVGNISRIHPISKKHIVRFLFGADFFTWSIFNPYEIL